MKKKSQKKKDILEIAREKGYRKPKWAIQQIKRESGLIEDICEHGIGHPNKEWLKKHDPDDKLGFSVHGCDGCCCSD